MSKGPSDHRMNSDLLGDDAREDDESTRYDGVRIYRNRESVLERFQRGQFLSGFMVPHRPDGIVLVPYSISSSMADCVLFHYNKQEMRQSDGSLGLQFATFRYVRIPDIQTTFGKRQHVSSREYCLMLPSRYCPENFDRKFAMITNEWRVMDKDGDIGRWGSLW